MRDLLILAIVLPGCLMALRRPWIGVLVWTWLSIMNPHRYAFGISYDAPLAAMAALSTLVGLLFTQDKASPFKGAAVGWFVLFTLILTVSWLVGLDVGGDYPQWNKVVKINFMILVALMAINSKQQVLALVWVLVLSLGLLGAKGGLFTLLTGGSFRVWGPPGSFIEDNNEFALALVMTVPLMRFLQMQTESAWVKRSLLVGMLFCAISALGSHSRGALLAIVSMAFFMWVKGKNKLGMGLMLVLVGVLLVAFMPEEWTTRMHSIENYQEDRSALGRISAWWTAWYIGLNHFLGVGFNPARPDLFAMYSPYPTYVHAAHSIYFQVLGNHGFPGLITFLMIWISTWRGASWILREAPRYPQAKWCVDLAAMCQVVLVAYAVGGAFLSLAYFDLPYNVMLLIMVTMVWIKLQAWKKESKPTPRWLEAFGFKQRDVTAV